ncbi:MAG: T9SS type A sorting domain-containing protein [Bacteroidota bacterium]
MKKITLFLALGFAINFVQSQTKNLGTPKSYSSKISPLEQGYKLPKIINDEQIAYYTEKAQVSKEKLLQYGTPHETTLNVFEQARKTTLPNGDNLYQFMIESPSAKSLNIIFKDFKLQEGTIVYLSAADKSSFIGAYTSLNNNTANVLGTELLYADKIIVEIQEPIENENLSRLTIGSIIHGFINLDEHLEKALNSSGSCNIDVNCPQGAGWEIPRNGVAMMVNGSGGFCSGSLVNNTSGVLIPYFLTAYHCYGGGSPASTVFRFRWESPEDQADCGTSAPSVNGPQTMNINGAVTRAAYQPSDFQLVEMNASPDVAWNVNYNGWDKSGIAPTSGAGIHHPSGDIKKIAITSTPYTTSSFGGSPQNHWHAVWSDGVTEGGSSGSPLFDQNRRIVGQLHGGASSCGGNDLSDEYGKFSASWVGGGTAATRLSDWLDPQNTGVDAIDADVTHNLDPYFVNKLVGFEATLCSSTGTVEPKIILVNGGSNALTNATVNYTIDGNNFVYNWSGTLGLYQSDTITLDPITLATGSHQFNAEVVNPNDVDENLTNNVIAKDFYIVVNGQNLTLTLNFDCYSDEISWQIVSENSDTIFVSQPYPDNHNTSNYTITESVCLDSSLCYDFHIFDSYGDGMTSSGCDNGTYSLTNSTNDTVVQLLSADANFGFSNVQNFCLDLTLDLDPLLLNNVLGVENTICTQSIQAQIILSNGEEAVLETATIDYTVDGVDFTFDWTGSLNQSESDTITLPLVNLTGTTHQFDATVVNPNGSTDVNLTNNSVSKTFTSIVGGTNLSLTMNLDCFAIETSWLIKNQSGTTLFQGPIYENRDSAYVMNHTVCFNDGCYTFTINDSNSNGLTSDTCETGSYYLNNVNNDTLVQLTEAEANFGATNTKTFCLGNNGLIEKSTENFISIFPNPSSNEFNIKSNDMIKDIELMDMTGKIVLQNLNISVSEFTLNQKMNNGIYVLKIRTENGTSIHKLIKK